MGTLKNTTRLYWFKNQNSKVTKLKIQTDFIDLKKINMEDLCLTFPEMILKNLDDQSLTKCIALCWLNKERRKVRTRQGTERLLWVEIIQKYVGNIEEFPDTWEKLVDKTPIEVVKDLALAVHQFFTSRLSRLEYQWNPLHVAAERGNLQLCQFIKEKTGFK